MADLKNFLKLIIIFIAILFVLAFIGGAIYNLTAPPSFANYNDNVTIDIGQDGYLTAHIDKSLEYKSENIADGEVKTDSNFILKWAHARNISYVNDVAKKGYVIVWKATPQEMNLDINDTRVISYYYGSIFNQNHMFAVYYLQYNPQNSMVYGIILDHNSINYDLSDLLYDILGLNKSVIKYHEYYPPSTSSSSRYGGVDNSPHSIARNDPDWYYDHYDYGDYDDIDEYLESQGYD